MTNETSKMGGWKKWLLVGSLCLNLLVIGAVTSTAIFHKKDGPKRGGYAGVGALGPMTRALPDAHHDALKEGFRSKRDSFRGFRSDMSAAGKEILDAIEAKPFDRDRLSSAFMSRHQALGGIATESATIFADVVSKMTDDERADFVSAAKEMQRKSGRDKRKSKSDKPE